jgi:hypothetical protein
MTFGETIYGLAAALAVIGVILKSCDRLLVSMMSAEVRDRFQYPSFQPALGVSGRLRGAVALGMRYLGVLLMGSLIIIPAVRGRNRSRAVLGSNVLAASAHSPLGPITVAIAGGLSF